ncbi:MAG: CvpA family protein, partial [Defluviitaleaceae bacterium]|nr:CvpA family protein [Defluviitaleaceae bacterium]
MNLLDIAILVLVAICALVGYRRGLIRTVYGLVSFFVSLFLSHKLYPHVAKFLQSTPLFEMIREQIKNTLGLGEMVTEFAAERQEEIVASLRLPAPLRALLSEQIDIHGVLQIDTIENYISGFFADIAINGIALVLVFLIV